MFGHDDQRIAAGVGVQPLGCFELPVLGWFDWMGVSRSMPEPRGVACVT